MNLIKPDFVFHLAAQAIVSKSYTHPIDTWNSNLISFLNILESLRNFKKKVNVVMITSDKCYLNVEKTRGYREDERLGGFENYSASKASCEILFNSYFHSYFKKLKFVKIVSARAGNVIGGGDWSEDRIVPDCIKAWSNGEVVKLRSPFSTRPWQHVLEPISGYLSLGVRLYNCQLLHGESFNFGPQIAENNSVLDLVSKMSEFWEKVKWEFNEDEKNPYECGLLNLNCDKAFFKLNWHSVLSFQDTVKYTTEWYKSYYEDNSNIQRLSLNQIENFISLANKKGLDWTK